MGYDGKKPYHAQNLSDPGEPCYYHNFQDEKLSVSNTTDCLESYVPPSGSLSVKVNYACRKESRCDELDCLRNEKKRRHKCFRHLKTLMTYRKATDACKHQGGSLPIIEQYAFYKLKTLGCPKSHRVQVLWNIRAHHIYNSKYIIGLFIYYSTKACLHVKTPPRLGHLTPASSEVAGRHKLPF
jgi:hypothetical protein